MLPRISEAIFIAAAEADVASTMMPLRQSAGSGRKSAYFRHFMSADVPWPLTHYGFSITAGSRLRWR